MQLVVGWLRGLQRSSPLEKNKTNHLKTRQNKTKRINSTVPLSVCRHPLDISGTMTTFISEVLLGWLGHRSLTLLGPWKHCKYIHVFGTFINSLRHAPLSVLLTFVLGFWLPTSAVCLEEAQSWKQNYSTEANQGLKEGGRVWHGNICQHGRPFSSFKTRGWI